MGPDDDELDRIVAEENTGVNGISGGEMDMEIAKEDAMNENVGRNNNVMYNSYNNTNNIDNTQGNSATSDDESDDDIIHEMDTLK